MFVLISINPYIGHFHPVVPVAAALRAAGHRVVVAAPPAFHPTITRAGFAAVAAGVTPESAWPWERPVTSRRVHDLLRVVRDVGEPDLVVREMTDFGAIVAAEVMGRPHVTVAGGLCFETDWWRHLAARDTDVVRAEHGLPPDPGLERLFPFLYLDTTPVWFQTPPLEPISTHRYFRVPVAGPAAQTTTARPLVYATLGTVFNRRPRLWRAIVAALAELPVDAVCTVGSDLDPRTLFPTGTPRNVRVARYLPATRLLPRAAVVVTHGGFSTVMGALRYGVPVLVLPLGADHFLNARRCRYLGVGHAIDPETATPRRLRTAVAALLADTTCRAHLRALQRTEQRTPEIRAAVPVLEQIANA